MEFWIIQGNDKIHLPIPPESFEVQTGNMNETIAVESIGEINILGKFKLPSISISSFFPAQDYFFCQHHNFKKPYEYVNLLARLKKDKVRLVITGTNVNAEYYIEDFNYGERDGTRDVYFTLTFKAYRSIKLAPIKVAKKDRKSSNVVIKKHRSAPVKVQTKKTNVRKSPPRKKPSTIKVKVKNKPKVVRTYSPKKTQQVKKQLTFTKYGVIDMRY